MVLGSIGYTAFIYFSNMESFALSRSDYELFADEDKEQIIKADIMKWVNRGLIFYSMALAFSCLSFIGEIIILIIAIKQSVTPPQPQRDYRVIPIPKLGFLDVLFGRKIFQVL